LNVAGKQNPFTLAAKIIFRRTQYLGCGWL